MPKKHPEYDLQKQCVEWLMTDYSTTIIVKLHAEVIKIYIKIYE
jgi:hypothetical protein